MYCNGSCLSIINKTDNSLHLAPKYVRIFVGGHYLFREANSFPRATLSENCWLLGTDKVQGQISEDIFKVKLFSHTSCFENWGLEYFWLRPSFTGKYSVT